MKTDVVLSEMYAEACCNPYEHLRISTYYLSAVNY